MPDRVGAAPLSGLVDSATVRAAFAELRPVGRADAVFDAALRSDGRGSLRGGELDSCEGRGGGKSGMVTPVGARRCAFSATFRGAGVSVATRDHTAPPQQALAQAHGGRPQAAHVDATLIERLMGRAAPFVQERDQQMRRPGIWSAHARSDLARARERPLQRIFELVAGSPRRAQQRLGPQLALLQEVSDRARTRSDGGQ